MRAQFDSAVAARLRGAGDAVAAHLSGGLDSSSVGATAARLLGPIGRRLVAYTAVPRPGYAGKGLKHRIGDEGPAATAGAALYPNIEHVLVPGTAKSPLRSLDRNFAATTSQS